MNLDPVDVIDRLPASAQARLQTARLRRDDAAGAMRAVLDQIAELREERSDLERQLRMQQHRYRDNRSPMFGGPPAYEETAATAALDAASRANARLTWIAPTDQPPTVELKKKIDQLFQQMRRLGAADDERSAIWNARGRLVRNVEDYLRTGVPAGCSLRALPEPAPKLGKGQNVLDEIENRRRRVRELAADLHATRSAPITPAAARQKMRETIETLAARGAPNVERLLHGGEIEFPQSEMRARPVFDDRGLLIAWQQPDALAFVTWLLKDAVVSKLDGEIAAEFSDEPGLSDSDRAAREATILRDALAVSREEVALVEMAWGQGMSGVEHRAEVDPLAFLNVELVTHGRTAA
jgi:hypothetical protein